MATAANVAARLLRLVSHLVCIISLPLLDAWLSAGSDPFGGWSTNGTKQQIADNGTDETMTAGTRWTGWTNATRMCCAGMLGVVVGAACTAGKSLFVASDQ